MTVALAAPSDTKALISILREKHAEDGIGVFDEEKALNAIARGLARDLAMIGVIRGHREIEASIGLFVETPVFSSTQVLGDMWLYVKGPYRKSTHAKNLLEFAKWAAKALEKPLLTSVIINEGTARKGQLYERNMEKAGAIFLFNHEAV